MVKVPEQQGGDQEQGGQTGQVKAGFFPPDPLAGRQQQKQQQARNKEGHGVFGQGSGAQGQGSTQPARLPVFDQRPVEEIEARDPGADHDGIVHHQERAGRNQQGGLEQQKSVPRGPVAQGPLDQAEIKPGTDDGLKNNKLI
jgi:hypothetical protein